MQKSEKSKRDESRFYLGHAPQELIEESKRIQRERKRKLRAKL